MSRVPRDAAVSNGALAAYVTRGIVPHGGVDYLQGGISAAAGLSRLSMTTALAKPWTLYDAIVFRAYSLVDWLIAARANLNDGSLHEAVADGTRTVVEQLIRAGADVRTPIRVSRPGDLSDRPPSAPDDSSDVWHWTPLHVACQYGHVDLVRTFLAHVSPDIVLEKGGETALLVAVRYEHTNVVRLLLESGASPTKGMTIEGSDGWFLVWTPLCQAAQDGHRDIAELLLTAGAPVADNVPGVDCAKDYASPLFLALKDAPMCHDAPHFDVADLLVEWSADLYASARGNYAGPGLLVCVCEEEQYVDDLKDVQIVRWLVEKGADFNHSSLCRGLGYGAVPLHIVCLRTRIRSVSTAVYMAQRMLDAKADVNRASDRGHTALYYACRDADEATEASLVHLLCSYGAQRQINVQQDDVSGFVIHAESITAANEATVVHAWLSKTALMNVPLHYIFSVYMTAQRTRDLLRRGHNILASSLFQQPNGLAMPAPTPLEIARARIVLEPRYGFNASLTSANLVVLASLPWHPGNHALFPVAERQHAVMMVKELYLLHKNLQLPMEAHTFAALVMEQMRLVRPEQRSHAFSVNHL